MADMVVDDVKWGEAWLDTPLGFRGGHSTREDAMRSEGCAVKSRVLEKGWPKHTGKLVIFDEKADRVVVRGHGDVVSPKFVWTGTVREYWMFWECD